MACRTVFAAVAVLFQSVVVQSAPGYVVPEVLMMRVKRSPAPMRSFSFSGFNPGGQMAAFTGMSEYPMFANYGPPTQDSYGPPPSGSEQAPVADQTNKQYGGTAGSQQPQEYGASRPGVGVAPAEDQNNNVEQQLDDNKKQHKGRGNGPSSNAEASFNAWFPIMFGVFPNGANGGGQSGNGGRGSQGQGQDQGSGFERSSGTTVIANSVSNGRNGVATSHAIAYGNPRSSQK